jgi:hypothetical protein
MITIESVPTTWDELRDGGFFRIVGHLLEAHYLEGASGLLAANDPEIAAREDLGTSAIAGP